MQELVESIKMAVGALTANKMRAFLTTLGVVVGITFVLMIGWGIGGLTNALEQTLAVFGDDILYVDKFDWSSDKWFEQRNRKDISYQQFLKVKERLRSPEYVVPTARQMGGKVRNGDLEISNSVVFGVTSDYNNMLGGSISEGRFFNDVEDNSGSMVAVLGYNIAENLFPHTDPIGRTVKIGGVPFTVVGTMPKRGTFLASFVDDEIMIPIKRFFGLYGSQSRIVINVKAGGASQVENVKYETIGTMREVRSLAPEMKDDFAVNTQEQFRQQTDQLRLIVWSVGLVMSGLSFLVGSIGIMNIMFVSVTERTKEIGIRKAVGATRRSILLQFLIEAILLCLMGAIVGLAITSTIALVVVKGFDVTFLSAFIPPGQIGIAVLVAIAVGVMAGIIPAFRAARMDPVDALRAE
jgi:putative ABC transport system permease protein